MAVENSQTRDPPTLQCLASSESNLSSLDEGKNPPWVSHDHLGDGRNTHCGLANTELSLPAQHIQLYMCTALEQFQGCGTLGTPSLSAEMD